MEQLSINYLSSNENYSNLSRNNSLPNIGSRLEGEGFTQQIAQISNVNTTNHQLTVNSFQTLPECKVWKNPMSLFRGAEYSQLTLSTGQEPLTFYDMNLSAQDHQTYFSCDADEGKTDYDTMHRAWRERNQKTRILLAHEALKFNPE